MSQSTTTPIKQAKAPAAAGSGKDPLHMIEKLETKTKAVYVLSWSKRLHMGKEIIVHRS
jgi:hypothetical protein